MAKSQMADDISSIGQILRDKRESKNLSIEDVHEATKITVDYINALEENRFDVFPNKVYARAFLRDYANFLGLDSSILLARYEEEYQTLPASEPIKMATGRSAWRIFVWALIIIVLAAGGIVGYDWWVKSSLKFTSARVQERSPATLSYEPLLPAKPRKIQSKQPASDTRPAHPPTEPSVSNKVTLQVTALRDVWVRVKCDGVRVYESIMPKGTTKTFTAREFINIRTGMAGAVQLVLDGVPQPPMGTLKMPGEKTFRRSQTVP